jgi:hypothetical protein
MHKTMSIAQAKTLFPDCQTDGSFDSPYDYSPIINSFGQVVLQVDDDDYQGDTFALLSKDGSFGFLSFGWGSCSVCDALQGCESYEELGGLIAGLEHGIKWFDSLPTAQSYIGDDEARKGSYYYHADTWNSFRDQVLLLSA